MSRKHQTPERGDGMGSKAVWDAGSSLYDSYELAALHGLLDRRLLAVAIAGVHPLPDDDEPQPATAERDKDKQQVVVAFRARRRRGGKGKVTLRALVRAVASWAVRPRPARTACACIGSMAQAPQGAPVEPVLTSQGKM
ncbi:hypothetical protein ACP4OV_027420 [Aristida adscensionis]